MIIYEKRFLNTAKAVMISNLLFLSFNFIIVYHDSENFPLQVEINLFNLIVQFNELIKLTCAY